MTKSVTNIEANRFSLVDPVGKVYSIEGRIYRGIDRKYEDYARELLSCGLIDELVKMGKFPDTKISNMPVEGYSLVLEHEKIFVSYPHEWAPEMLKQAALATLQVNEIANKYGYKLKDFHPYNILFEGINPVFIDFGSFEKAAKESVTEEFVYGFCLPLKLYSTGDFYLGHKLLLDAFFPGSRLLVGDMSEYLRQLSSEFFDANVRFSKLRLKMKNIRKGTYRFLMKARSLKMFKVSLTPSESIGAKVQAISFKDRKGFAWSGYQQEYISEGGVFLTDRFNRIIELTTVLEGVKTAVDIAGNNGVLPESLFRKARLEKITHLDYDLLSLNSAFDLYTRGNSAVNIVAAGFLDLLMDSNIVSRLKSDIVYGLALTHHLILTQHLEIQQILGVFHELTNKYVFIEFMPKGLWSDNTNSAPPVPEWYNLDWFAAHFKNYFSVVHQEELESNRVLFIGLKHQ